MQHLEQTVARHEQTGDLAPETLVQLVEARNQIRAGVAGRATGTPDADRTLKADQRTEGSETLQAPNDARLSIRGNQAVFDVNVHLVGPSATPEIARAFERQIQHDWGRNPATGAPWTYTDPTGRTYEVRFDVDVDVVSTRQPADRQALIDRHRRPGDLDNYIEIVSPHRAQQLADSGDPRYEHGFRPNVDRVGGDTGRWQGFDGRRASMEDVASHEFGHLLGFMDRYHLEERREDGRTVMAPIPETGYENNIMGRPRGGGHVTQQMIDDLMNAPAFTRSMRGTDLPNMSITGRLIE